MLIYRTSQEMNDNHEEQGFFGRITPNCWPDCTDHTLFQTKMVQISTLSQARQNGSKTTLFVAVHAYIAYLRGYLR